MRLKFHIVSLAILYLLLTGTYATAQNVLVSGVVKGVGSDETLIGVNVLLKGTSIGTSTGFDGDFEIEVPPDGILIFSYIGFQTAEIAIANRSIVNVVLEFEASQLDEVIVVGYGTTKKRDLTGSVSSIRAEDIQAVPVLSADQALQGRAAGVVVQETSGEPGAGTSIRIRGTSSISAGNEPLYVIDGIPMLAQASDISSGAAQGPRLNPLSTINPNDIASIEVLKDASAAAIYGARAANGVILITTKRGKAGQTTVNFNFYQGWQNVRNPYTLLDASQYAHFVNEANYYAGNGRVYDDPSKFGKGTDWQSEIFRTAPMSNYELSFTGGSENIQYAISGAYYQQDGVIKGSDFTRYNFRANLDGKVHPRITLSNSMMFSHTKSNKILTDDNAAFDGGIVTAALSFNPMLSTRDENGNLILKNYAVDNDGNPIDGTQLDDEGNVIPESTLNTFANPLLKIYDSSSESKISRIIDNFSITFNILDGLDLKASLGVDFSTSRSDQFTPSTSRPAGDSFASSGSNSTFALLNEYTLSYNREWDKHRISAVGGFSAQKTSVSALFVNAIDFSTDQFGYYNYATARGADVITNYPDFTFLSWLGRVNYALLDKYLFTFTGRADGSSKFGENNKWGFFPSGSVAWRVSQEDFMSDVNWLGDLKVRMSYGIVGNESIGPYLSQALLVPVDISFDNNLTIGFEPFLFPNSDLRWESTRQFNVGVDGSVLDGRFGFTMDFYIKSTFDLLLTTDVPFYTGFSSVFSNVGDLENRGFEFTLRSYNLVRDLKWNTDFNISFNQNEITSLAGRDNIPNSGGLFGIESWALLKEGEPVGKFYGLVTDGIFQIGDDPESVPRFQASPPLTPGDRKFKDLNGDGVIDDSDRAFIGNAQPDFSFGFINNFSYKGFDLSIFIQGVVGNDIVNFNKFLIERENTTSNITLDYFANRWTPQNPTNEYPKVNADPAIIRRYISDAEVEDGSYVRIKTITIGYRPPANFLKKVKLADARIYFTAKNAITFTKYSGYDPEVSHFGQSATNMGADLGGFPNTSSFILGINVGF